MKKKKKTEEKGRDPKGALRHHKGNQHMHFGSPRGQKWEPLEICSNERNLCLKGTQGMKRA